MKRTAAALLALAAAACSSTEQPAARSSSPSRPSAPTPSSSSPVAPPPVGASAAPAESGAPSAASSASAATPAASALAFGPVPCRGQLEEAPLCKQLGSASRCPDLPKVVANACSGKPVELQAYPCSDGSTLVYANYLYTSFDALFDKSGTLVALRERSDTNSFCKGTSLSGYFGPDASCVPSGPPANPCPPQRP